MNVHMHNDKYKSKAMKIAVSVHGVISVSIGENSQLEVIGEGVDSVSLANSLRKKFPYTNIVSVAAIKETKSPDSSPPPSPPPYPVYNYGYPPPPAYYRGQYYDPGPPNCSII
ncbi:hypothetical protein ACS0TY_033240 [Phlomoides rotata]